MIDKQNNDRSLSEMANAAFAAAAKGVLAKARQTGTDVVIWRNGGVAKVSPEELQQQLELEKDADI